MRRVDWNRIADAPFGVWSGERLLRHLLAKAAEGYGTCACKDPRVCEHTAAVDAISILRIADHPDDCPECARIHGRPNDTAGD